MRYMLGCPLVLRRPWDLAVVNIVMTIVSLVTVAHFGIDTFDLCPFLSFVSSGLYKANL